MRLMRLFFFVYLFVIKSGYIIPIRAIMAFIRAPNIKNILMSLRVFDKFEVSVKRSK